MGIEQLRALLDVLKEYGVSDYSADGVSLKLAPTGFIGIENVTAPAREVPPDPDVLRRRSQERALFDKLPPEYRQMFTLGDQ